MPNTTDYKFGDVVLVPFPFTDQGAAKRRPAVVVNSNAYSQQRPDIILMAVTSQVQQSRFGDVVVKEWQQAGLLRPSIVKPIFTTVEKGLVLKKLGRFNKEDRSVLQEALKLILGE